MVVSLYHKLLRASALIVVFVLLFDGGFVLSITKQLSNNAIQYLASSSSGVFASVPQNELNTLSAELNERERALAEREREIASRDYVKTSEVDYSTYILSSILFIITVLILLNYVLDWLRERRTSYEGKTT